jgi:hypothetical protein
MGTPHSSRIALVSLFVSSRLVSSRLVSCRLVSSLISNIKRQIQKANDAGIEKPSASGPKLRSPGGRMLDKAQ